MGMDTVFSQPATTPEQVQDALEFVNQSGWRRVFAENGVKDLVDCVLGVKAGVDRNGRKDRGGKERVRNQLSGTIFWAQIRYCYQSRFQVDSY